MDCESRFDITIPKDFKLSEIKRWIEFELQILSQLKGSKEVMALEWSDLKPRFLFLRAHGD